MMSLETRPSLGSGITMRPMVFVLVFVLLAVTVLLASHPYGNADMFYISPYYPNGQVVFHQIALTIGTVPGNILYLLSVVLGGFLFHVMLRHIPRQC